MNGRTHDFSSRVVRSASISLIFGAAFAAIYLYFVRTRAGQKLDAASFDAIGWLHTALGPASGAIRVILILLAALVLLLLVLVAVFHRRFRDAAMAVAIGLVTLAVSPALKGVFLTRPHLGDFGYQFNTFPSDHEAITMAAVIGSFLLLPVNLRTPPVETALLLLGTLSGLFQIVAFAHRLSDVLGGALLAGLIAVWVPSGGRKRSFREHSILWIFVGFSAVLGSLCIATWSWSGYSDALQVVATVGIALCTAGCVCASVAATYFRTDQ
jgi:hypothetical protein